MTFLSGQRRLTSPQTRWELAPWREPLGAAGHVAPAIFADTWPPAVVAELERLRQQARAELRDDPVALARLDYWTWTFPSFLAEAREETAKAAPAKAP